MEVVMETTKPVKDAIEKRTFDISLDMELREGEKIKRMKGHAAINP